MANLWGHDEHHFPMSEFEKLPGQSSCTSSCTTPDSCNDFIWLRSGLSFESHSLCSQCICLRPI